VAHPSSAHPPLRAVRGASQPAARSIRPLVLLVLVCLAPLLFALLAYYVPALDLRPVQQTNYGTLVQPQRPIPAATDLRLRTLDGQAFDLRTLRGKWLLLAADQALCPPDCARKLFILRNSHASQGKNVDRIQRVWLILDDAPVPDAVRSAYAGTVFLRADPVQAAAFLTPEVETTNAHVLTDSMWIIDPLGNLMLQFPPDADPVKVRKDIAKLLFSSRVG